MSKEANIINNLICFNINFSKFAGVDLSYQAPSYIIEKFNKWIAGEVTRKYWEMIPMYRKFDIKKTDLNSIVSEFDNRLILDYMGYQKIWGSSSVERNSKAINRVIRDLKISNIVCKKIML